jgi:predicted ribosome quality control (RQC) complex YloA/Tae2 family protein
LDAALLAAWHSKLRHEAIIDVMWTRRKHVRKAKGAPSGQVTVSASKTISVREDPRRLERIYGTEGI